MVTTYIIVLALSAWLFAVLLLYVAKRFGKLFGNPLLVSPGFVILLPLLGFLAVVAAPPAMLVGCILLAGSHLTRRDGYLPHIARWGVPAIAALLASSHLSASVMAQVPPILLQVIALGVLYTAALSADYVPERLAPASVGILASSLPLLAAPFFGAPSYIAVDIVLLASILLGANMTCPGTVSVRIARQPFGLILGWLAVSAALHGAWIPALVALLVYSGTIVLALTQPRTELEPYAP